jgi:hypothetical protein
MHVGGRDESIEVHKKDSMITIQKNHRKPGVLSFRWCDFLYTKLNSSRLIIRDFPVGHHEDYL